MRRSPFLANLLLLLLALFLSVAVGAVSIPPETLGRMFLAQIPGLEISPDWPVALNTNVFQ